ncbi:MAG TPA: UDP-N-acetylmuramoyl-L-alanine--D-glutamate ligase [Rhabdochlamydiaceae bacterium]|jgi:UDP-N-acetylmuramoylalanine--D-glutamate ligase|nr:UDP-N-acetylmuramoyl-L-alanine--D-glutamate ligase [Rhabdochlamydiaceae bacterium]
MKILVIGLGKSGQAAYNLLVKDGHTVIGTDDDSDHLKKLALEGISVQVEPRVEEFDLVVLSPGIPPSNRFYATAIQLGKEITGEAELALKRLHQPCIVITGTNGKTTVTLLTEHILKSSGLKAKALGNVGTPLTSYLHHGGEPQEIMVVELSSFQLELMKTPVVDIGMILNITPDHLDRYSTMEEYAKAKCRLQNLMKDTGNFWVHETMVKEFEIFLKLDYQTYGKDPQCNCWTDKRALKSGEKIETILPIRYRDLGEHESENVLAAWILCKKFGVGSADFLAGLETFKKPAHRIEFVATLDGVDYFNDSKGTNIDATIKAVEAMQKDVVLIAGGVDKGSSYALWKKSFAGKVKRVVAIGQAAAKIARELKPEYDVEIVASLQEAVECARQQAKEGMSVLLSPGCSSYDMFRDYAHRGDEFKKFVLKEKL